MVFLPRFLVVVMAIGLLIAAWGNGQRWYASIHGELVDVLVVTNTSLYAQTRSHTARITVRHRGKEQSLLVNKGERDRYFEGAIVPARWLGSRDLLVATDGDHAASTITMSLGCMLLIFVWFRLPRWMTG